MICVNDVDTDCQASANHKYHDQICHGGQTSAVLTSEMKSHWRCDRALHKPIIEIPLAWNSHPISLSRCAKKIHISLTFARVMVYIPATDSDLHLHTLHLSCTSLKGDPLQGDSGCCCLMPKRHQVTTATMPFAYRIRQQGTSAASPFPTSVHRNTRCQTLIRIQGFLHKPSTEGEHSVRSTICFQSVFPIPQYLKPALLSIFNMC